MGVLYIGEEYPSRWSSLSVNPLIISPKYQVSSTPSPSKMRSGWGCFCDKVHWPSPFCIPLDVIEE
jgi:hypothetical protein